MPLRCLSFLLSCASFPVLGADPPYLSPALAGALRTSGLPAAAESVTLPFKSTPFGEITLEVKVNGAPVQLVLDTGAVCTALSPETARRLGLQAERGSENQASSATGGQLVSRRALTQRLSLGDAWTENEPVVVFEMIPGMDGLLGMGTLADWDVRIDPAARKLTLFPAGKAPPLEGETVLPLTCQLLNPQADTSNPQGFRSLSLRVPVWVGDQELMAIPDTGFGGIFQLSSARMAQLAPAAMKDTRLGLATGLTLSGQSVSRETKLPEFTFGPDTLHGLPASVIDAAPGSLVESKGVIGLGLLHHYVMTFRFAAGELRLLPHGTVQEITHASTAGISLDPEFKILSVMPEGPADKAGLHAGDEMLEIEGHPIKTMTQEEFAAFKRLPPGTVVKVRYHRSGLGPVVASLVMVER